MARKQIEVLESLEELLVPRVVRAESSTSKQVYLRLQSIESFRKIGATVECVAGGERYFIVRKLDADAVTEYFGV